MIEPEVVESEPAEKKASTEQDDLASTIITLGTKALNRMKVAELTTLCSTAGLVYKGPRKTAASKLLHWANKHTGVV